MFALIKSKALPAGARLRDIGLAAVLAGAFSGLMPAVVHADGLLSPGTVVSSQPMALPSELAAVATAKRVKYISSDVNNNTIIVSSAIITPNVRPSHPNIVAWAHPTTGVGDNCAPSLNLDVFWPDAADAVRSYLDRGWVVAATDYQGLSTLGVHQYLVGNTEARAVIDSVRAARNVDHSLTNEWVVSGQSQGGQASLFTGEIASTYGTGLDLRGVVSLSPVSNEEFIGPALVGTPAQGYLVMGLVGLAAADSSVHVSSILAAPALVRLPVVFTGCFNEVMDAYANLTPSQLLVGGQLPDDIVAKFASYGDPAQQASSAPIFLVQGTDDTTIPPDLTAFLQTEICAYGQPSDLEYVDGATHDTISTLSTGIVGDYITARFAGEPAPSNCE